MLCTAAFAVPEILCDKGLVALICITVTIPIEKPKHPATSMAPQKSGEINCCPRAWYNVAASKYRIMGVNNTIALTLL